MAPSRLFHFYREVGGIVLVIVGAAAVDGCGWRCQPNSAATQPQTGTPRTGLRDGNPNPSRSSVATSRDKLSRTQGRFPQITKVANDSESNQARAKNYHRQIDRLRHGGNAQTATIQSRWASPRNFIRKKKRPGPVGRRTADLSKSLMFGGGGGH